MPSSEDWIEGPGALSFYSKAYTPTSTPRAHIVFAHGFMEHIQRYEHVFDRWMLHGYSIFAFDQRGASFLSLALYPVQEQKKSTGFGKTGQKNDQQGITSWPKALADLDYFINREATSHPDVPLFLFGHSMGGALSIAYATRQPLPTGVSRLSGVIASAPLIDQVPKVKASSALVKAGSVLGRVLPSLQFSVGVPSNDISRDDAVNKAYAADPLCPPIGSVCFSFASDRWRD